MKNDDEKRLKSLLQRKDSMEKFDLEKFYHLTYDVISEMRNPDCEWSKIQFAGVVFSAMFRNYF